MRQLEVAREGLVLALHLRGGLDPMLHLFQLGAQIGVAPLQPGHLRVHRIDLGFQLHHGGTADRVAGTALAGGNARLEGLDLALEALDVRVVFAVALAGLGENGLLGLQLSRQ